MLAGLLLPTIVAFASGFFDLIFSLLLCARVGPALDMGKPAERGLWVSGLPSIPRLNVINSHPAVLDPGATPNIST